MIQHVAPEEIIAALEHERDYWRDLYRHHKAVFDHSRDLAVMWHGKYALVKHENNVLRRKLWRQKHAGEAE